MISAKNLAVGFIDDYEFVQVSLESPRAPRIIDFKDDGLAVEVNFFENLDQPYVTGNITIVDSRGILSKLDILGGETITFTLKSNKENSKEITKKFYISAIISITKVDSNREVYQFHLKEDHEYESNLINVNRSYSDKCSSIIEKIAKNYINKEIISSGNDKQSTKIIIPNLNPIDAMSWIKNRATTVDGYPFYLYSTLYDNKLRFIDLGTMLQGTPMNAEAFVYGFSASSQPTGGDNRRVIIDFECKHTEDLYSLIRLGLVGSDYEYIDLVKNDRKQFKFDIVKDLLKPIIEKNVLPKNQNNPTYSTKYNLNGKSFNELQSRKITRLGGVEAFDGALSYSESSTLADYKLDVISDSMHNILHKAPMTVMLSGYDFIDGNQNTSIGNIIRLEFEQADPDLTAEDDPRDLKLSGDYLIFSARHIFSQGKYRIELGCVKMANYRSYL